MDYDQYQQYRLQQNLWHVVSNDGTTLVARNNKTGESYSGTTAGFNAIFNSTPDMNLEDDYVKSKRDPLTGKTSLMAGSSQVAVLAASKYPQIDASPRVVPTGLPTLPMALSGWGVNGPICTPDDAITAMLLYNAALVNAGVYYVKPSTGSDAANGTSKSTPFATVGYALKTAAAGSRVVMLEDAVIPSFDLRNTDASQTTEQVKWLDGNGFSVIVRDTGPDLTAQTWAADGTYTTCYKTTLTLTGSAAVSRVLRTDQLDKYGEPVGLKEYASAALLGAATSGYFYDTVGKELWVNLSGENVQARRGILKPLYLNTAGTSRIMSIGSKLGFSGIRSEGCTFHALDGGGRRPEFWLHNCKVMWSFDKGVNMEKAGWIVTTDCTIYSSKADNINAFGPSALGKGLMLSVRLLSAYSGDVRVYADDATLQAESAHGGSDHVAFGCIYESANGQGVADTCANTYSDVTWMVGCIANKQGRASASFEFGSAATTASRTAYLDTCKSAGPLGADLVISTNGVVKTYNTELPSVTGGSVSAYVPNSP